MKTDWPHAWNPESLSHTPDLGYRYLGRDEPILMTDEVCQQREGKPYRWSTLTALGWSHGISRMDQWTYRRALCIDDQYAPPPDRYAEPGYRMLTLDEMSGSKQKGDQFWVNAWLTAMDLRSNFLKYFYYRRPIANPTLNPTMSFDTTPKQAAPAHQTILITVDNPILSRAVQEIAFEAGYLWYIGGIKTTREEDQPLLILREGKEILYSDIPAVTAGRYPDAIQLNAKTDLGQLIYLLAVHAPVGPRVNGYDASYLKGDSLVVFGCARISLGLLRKTAELMAINSEWSGNRQVASITLSSGVTLHLDYIKAILAYVDEVNQAT